MAKEQPKDTLEFPVSTRFDRKTHARLIKASRNSKRYFGLNDVSVNEIIRTGVRDYLEKLEGRAAKGARIAR